MYPFRWPIPPLATVEPVWTGCGFRVGGQHCPVLSYTVGSSGWSDDLTTFHEDTAGSDHPIDRASRHHALKQIQRHAAGRTNPVILEVGCSSGFLLEAIRYQVPDAFVIGADYVRGPLTSLADACRNCRCSSSTRKPPTARRQRRYRGSDQRARTHRGRCRSGAAVATHPQTGGGRDRRGARRPASLRRVRPGAAALPALQTVRAHPPREAGFAVPYASSLGTLLYPAFWVVSSGTRIFDRSGSGAERDSSPGRSVSWAGVDCSRANIFDSVTITTPFWASRTPRAPPDWKGLGCLLPRMPSPASPRRDWLIVTESRIRLGAYRKSTATRADLRFSRMVPLPVEAMAVSTVSLPRFTYRRLWAVSTTM